MKKTILINFYAGPGSGKSTICAETFAKLKWLNVNCEMALEWVKDTVWEENYLPLTNQMYITSQQQYRLFKLKNKVDVILTDSPLLQGLIYDDDNDQNLLNLVQKDRLLYDNIDIFINRKKKYNPKGRVQSLNQAIEKDIQIKDFLNKQSVNYIEIDGIEESVPLIVNIIKEKLNSLRFFNKVLIISGSSGSGKTTVATNLLNDSNYSKIKTYTTRSKRSENDDYNFLEIEDFTQKVSSNYFLEWEEVYENLYYGTSNESLEKVWVKNQLPILVMDVKGAIKLKEKLGNDCVTVFLDVPADILKERLESRNTESTDWIAKRLTRISIENSLKSNFDYCVKNDNLDNCVSEINNLINTNWEIL